jgi:hypothetical protein
MPLQERGRPGRNGGAASSRGVRTRPRWRACSRSMVSTMGILSGAASLMMDVRQTVPSSLSGEAQGRGGYDGHARTELKGIHHG